MLILIGCTIAACSWSTVSDGIWAGSNDRSIVKAGLQDTLGGIKGKIVDSVTNTPIPFATITFYKDDSGSMTIVCDGKGEFSTDIKHGRSKVQLSAIGYQERTCYLASDHSILLRLTPASNTLPDVIVSTRAKKMSNANSIIKKVNKHIEQNYGELSFDQKFKFYSTTRNYDTTKGEITILVDIHFDNDQRSMMARKWRQDTVNCDAAFFNFIGVPRLLAGDIIPSSDILRKGLAIGENQRKSFDFKMLAHYQDKKQGAVYLVSFRPNNTFNDSFLGGRTVGGLSRGYLKGEMLIREDDYAVVNLKYIWEMKVEGLNKSTETLYHTPYWKADRVERIMFSAIIYKYAYTYAKDTVTGKYFVQTIKADCYNTGYQIENHRKVQLNYQFDATSLGIDNIVK